MARQQSPLKFRDYVESFVEEHCDPDGDGLLVEVTPEEAEDLGLFFARGICGWMRRLSRERRAGVSGGVDVDVSGPGGQGEDERELLQ